MVSRMKVDSAIEFRGRRLMDALALTLLVVSLASCGGGGGDGGGINPPVNPSPPPPPPPPMAINTGTLVSSPERPAEPGVTA